MNKKHIVIQHPCFFSRLGLEELLSKQLPDNNSAIFTHFNHLDEYHRHLPGQIQVDIVVLNILNGNYTQGELLSRVIQLLRLHQPHCQIILLMNAKSMMLLGSYMHELQNVQMILEPEGTLGTIEAQLTGIFNRPVESNENLTLKVPQLSQRELSVLRLLLKGKTITYIACQLKLNYKTISNYKRSAQMKLGITSMQPLLLNGYDREVMNRWLYDNTRHSDSVTAVH
ncbi:hypothetical protein Z042_16440 [Chania multitudinisentens RB-25]|uniref:HTH luxR-type domain-containing protein n=1 Tax=Chania multitudinisentens RB-25 TaxID=1441930 RepID=W0LGB3_9GAMM|nr:LuxR C-terminal-related transcriptional regulator [Chania multitudinisentens]AHG22873.1 hypothetical protein Z042_16440 [Chania multitudinisentens RB-25]